MNGSERFFRGDLLRLARQEAGLTQQALADRVGLTRGRITSLENGQVPSIPTLCRLCYELGVTPSWLLDLSEARPQAATEADPPLPFID